MMKTFFIVWGIASLSVNIWAYFNWTKKMKDELNKEKNKQKDGIIIFYGNCCVGRNSWYCFGKQPNQKNC